MTESETAGRAPVQLVRAVDPAAEARSLAASLGADVVGDLPSAEREVRVRVEAGRRALGGEPGADDELLARAGAIRAAATAPPPIADEDVAELQRLASDLARASRIRTRTEARFNENLQARLAASTGVALHPGAIRAAADAVVEAERILTDAERALADLGPIPGAEPLDPVPAPTPAFVDDAGGDDDDPVLRRPLDDFDEEALDKRRSVTRGVAVFFVVTGLGLVALFLGQPPAVAVAAATLGLALAILVAVRGRRAAGRTAGDKAAQAARLADLPSASGVDELDDFAGLDDLDDLDRGGEVPAPAPARAEPDEAWLEQRVTLDAARAAAEEQVRLARNRWRQLAGPDADAHHPEDIIRAHDPQLAYDPHVAEASPTVRTVAAFHRTAMARWRVLWAAVGRDDPPEPEQLEATLEAVLGDHRRARATLRSLEAAEGRDAARAAARRPLVLLEPRTWVAPGRLAQLLSSIPPDGRIVLVERDGATEPAT